MAGEASVQRDALRVLLRAPYGPIGRDLLRRGLRVESLAKQLVGRKTNELADSIAADRRPHERPDGLGLYVRATARHALVHHQGSRPHEIVPRNATVLRFEVGGTVVFTRHVNHPGTRANPFLRNALSAAR